MDFNLTAYLKHKGFTQTRESDKRDIFEMGYYHPFEQINSNVILTISYNSGITSELSYSHWRMWISLEYAGKSRLIFEGLPPNNFDQAEDLISLVLPSLEELKIKER